MTKKLWALLTALTIVFCAMAPSVLGAEEEQPAPVQESVEQKEAEEILALLAEGELFPQEEAVTRGGYVKALTALLKVEDAVPEEYFFADVKSFSEYAGSVYAAYGLGWISRDDVFEPERPITGTEAVKVLICAMGYGWLAEARGGYPAGYQLLARQTDILDGVTLGEEAMDRANSCLLVCNALRAPILDQLTYGDEEHFRETGETLLSQVYDIYEVEGVVSRTAYNALDGNESDGMEPTLEIEGVRYDCEDSAWQMLGVRYRAFIRRASRGGRDQVVYLTETAERREIPLTDLMERDGQTLRYWTQDGKERTCRLAADAEIIYNGRKAAEHIEDCFTAAPGQIVLVDNDENNAYDTVYVNRYTYLMAQGYDGLGVSLRDKNNAAYTLDLAQAAYEILDESGAAFDLYDVTDGDVFQVIRSRDGGFVQAVRQTRTITGMVARIDEPYLIVDNTEYYISDYFRTVYGTQAYAGRQGTFYVSQDGVLIAAALDTAGMRYGYLKDAMIQNSGFQPQVRMKIFTQEGQWEDRKVREKRVLVDGVRTSAEKAYEAVLAEGLVKPQLIRYGINGDGEIVTLDTATATLPQEPGLYPDEKNKLTRYTFASSSIRYKTYSSSFGSFFTVNGSVVFSIPTDTEEEEEYAAQGKALFSHDQMYTVEAYDLNDVGEAAAVVYSNASSATLQGERPFILVQSVAEAVNEEGETGYQIDGWQEGAYVSRFMKADTVVTKNSVAGQPVDSMHPLLSGGDIIRCAVNNSGQVSTVEVDFDARAGAFVANHANFNLNDNAIPMFYDGMFYRTQGNVASISSKRLSDGSYDFAPANLRYVSLDTANIVRYDCETGDVHPILKEDIKTYVSDGRNAYYAVLCQSNFVTKTIVLYDRTEARR